MNHHAEFIILLVVILIVGGYYLYLSGFWSKNGNTIQFHLFPRSVSTSIGPIDIVSPGETPPSPGWWFFKTSPAATTSSQTTSGTRNGVQISAGGTRTSVSSQTTTPRRSSNNTVYGGSVSPPPATPATSQANPRQIPYGFTLAQLSPYFQKVRLNGVSAGFRTRGFTQVTIYGGAYSGEKINVTGWTLRAQRGLDVRIPRAVPYYDASGGALETDIRLGQGDVLYIYSNKSPVGRNFWLNKCTGYLGNDYTFLPAIRNDCPTINRRDITYLSGVCQNYIVSLNGCRQPAAQPPVPINDYECRAFLYDINYNGCVNAHRLDPDFLRQEVRVWLSIGDTKNVQFLDELHDRLLLLDNDGLLVDVYEY